MRTEAEMIAYALEADPALLPYLPELLADLEELGSDAEEIAEVVEDLALPPQATVIDLGCGKGAVSLELASELDLDVLGIELFEPFVEHCKALAQAQGVAARCRFMQGDVAKLAGTLEPVDLVVFAALGDVLGRLDETVGILRRYLKPGGYMLISDPFLRESGSADFPGFEQYAKREETLARLTSHGDRVVKEVLADEEDDEDDEDDLEDEGALIAARAAGLAAQHPEIKDALMAFAAMQASENQYIEENLQDAIWVLQRGPS